MKTSLAMALFFLGMILTLFGVGGIENSINDYELARSLVVSLVGLMLSWVATIALRVSEYYDNKG